MFLTKLKKDSQAASQEVSALILTKDDASALREKVERELVEIHRDLTKKGRYTRQEVALQTLRSEEGSASTKGIEVDAKDLELFFAQLDTIDKEVKSKIWGGNRKPSIFADLSYLTIAEPEKLVTFYATVNVFLSQTIVNKNIVFSFSGKNLKFDLTNTSIIRDSLRIQVLDDTELSIKFSSGLTLPPVRIYSKETNPRKKPILRIDASGFIFPKKVRVEGRFEIQSFNFTGATLQEEISVDHCIFLRSAEFIGAEFHKNIQFERCTFVHPPNLHNATYKRHLIFESCKFEAANSLFNSKCELQDIDAYRVLRLHYAKLKNGRMESLFFAHEQRGERSQGHADPVDKFLSWCFDLISNYGQSTSRIAVSFALWNTAFTLIYFAFFSGELVAKTEPFTSWLAMSFTLQNAFNPLALFSEKNLVSTKSFFCFELALIQALGSIAVFTIFLLTIRTRFRRGGNSES